LDDKSLKPISIELLFGGMTVRDDIYDADYKQMLVKGGTALTANTIKSIRRLNADRETIYVSPYVYRELVGETLPCEVVNREKLEEKTGYAEVKSKTFELLTEMSQKETIQQEKLCTVADELSERLEIAEPSAITMLINALAPVDEYLQRHCVNLGLLNGLFGRWMGMSKKAVDNLVLIGLLHDCGKAMLPAAVLSAPRRLSAVEYEVVKMHPVYTYNLLTEFSESVRHPASSHHERMDGTGYPNKLAHAKIPREARITAITDVYDAVVSQRAYKTPRSPFSVMAMLNELSGTELDAELVGIFNTNMAQQLIGKPVAMSDGTFGVVRSCDPKDIEHPTVEIAGIMVKSSKNLYCTSMYTED